MFVTEETAIGLPFGWAVAQLGSTIESGRFREVSDQAYAAGLAVLASAGPLGAEAVALAASLPAAIGAPG